jgi:hypothetical protein
MANSTNQAARKRSRVMKTQLQHGVEAVEILQHAASTRKPITIFTRASHSPERGSFLQPRREQRQQEEGQGKAAGE